MADPTGQDTPSGDSYGASSAAVPGLPSTAQPIPAPEPVSGYGDSASTIAGSAVQQPQFNNHGYFVPTNSQLAKWDQSVAAGMSLDGVDPRVKASMYAAKGGNALATYDSARTMVLDPARDAMQKDLGAGWQALTTNPLGFVVNKTGDALNWLGSQGQGIGRSLDAINDSLTGHPDVDAQNLASHQLDKTDPNSLGNAITGVTAFGARAGQEFVQAIGSGAKSLLDAVTLNPGAASKDLALAQQHGSNFNALIADPTAKGVGDVVNQVTNAATLMPHLSWNAVQQVPGVPQQLKDFLKESDDRVAYGILSFQKKMDDWTSGFSGKVADGIASVGSAFSLRSGIPQATQGMANQLRQSATTITPAQMEGGRTVLNPLNYVGLGEASGAMRAEGALVRPSFLGAIDNSGNVLKALKTEEGVATSKLTAAQGMKAASQQGVLLDSGKAIADLKEQQALAASNVERTQSVREAAAPSDGGPPHPQFDQDIADAKAHLTNVQGQLAQAVQAHPGSPDQIPLPLLDQKIQDAQGALADIQKKTQETTQLHQQQIQAATSQLQRNAGLANQVLGGTLQGGAAAARATTAASKWVGDNFNRMTDWMAQGNPSVAAGLRYSLQGAAGGVLGHLVGHEVAGAFSGEVLPWIAHTLPQIGETMGVVGKELMIGQSSSPFFRRVADQLSIDHPNGLPAWSAHLLDNSLFNDISRTSSGAVNSGLHAGLINAGIGFAGSGGSPQAAAQGFLSGSILGMAGGAYGTWRDFGTPGDVATAQIGDRYRFMQSLDANTKKQFQTYSPEAQLSISSAFTQHPDLRLDFNAPEGSGGMYKVSADKRTATISIDPTAKDGAIPLILSHEFNHHLQSHGMQAELTAKMLGDPITGQAGWFSRRDANGKPVRNPDGSFQPNDDLVRLQNELAAKYQLHGAPEEAARLNPERTIRELAAESAVGMISPGALQPRDSLSGKLLDAGTAPFVTKNFVKSAIATLGNGFDPQSQIVGTGLFTGEKRIPILDSIINDWNNNRRIHSPLETGDSQTLLPKDFANKTDADIRAVTGPVDAWKTDGRGNIQRAFDGTPIMKTKKQMDLKSVEVGKTIHQAITNLSDDQRQGFGIRPNGDGGYILPSRSSGGLEKIAGKTLSPDGLRNLRTWTDLSSLDPNAALSVDYLGAYERGKFRRPVPSSVPLKTHVISPLAVEVTKSGNLIGHSFDHGQLLENAALSARKGTGKPLGFDSMAKIYSNARNLLELVSKGQPSESFYSPEQKRFLYENLGLEPKVNGQNIFSDMAKSSRSESIYKTLRIDRIVRSNIIPGNRLNVHNGTYDSLRDYKTTGRLALENYGTEVHPAAFGRGPDYSRGAAAITSQQAPYNQRSALNNAGQNFFKGVSQPAPQPQVPALRAQPGSIQAQPAAPRALPVSGPPQAQPATPYALPASGVPRAQPLNIDRSLSATPGSFTPGRGQMQVQKIVMHSTDGKSVQGDISTLTGHDPIHPASVHFYVERDGKIHQFVNTSDTAYQAGPHNSTGYNNNNTIGIEQQHEDGKDDWPDAQVRSAARLVAQQLRENPSLTVNDVVGHSDIAPERKQDPVGYPWGKFRQLVQADSSQTAGKPRVSRLGMARRIIGLETDLTQGLRIKQLPPGDRSGPGYEVGGITPRWDGATASHLAYLVQNGRQKEAMTFAKNYVAGQTDGSVNQWLGGQANADKHPGLQFAIRDIAWQHGDSAVPRILARALGFNPRFLTPSYVEAAARQDPQGFLNRIKQSRTDYVNIVQQPAANLHQGVLNRVALAHEISSSL